MATFYQDLIIRAAELGVSPTLQNRVAYQAALVAALAAYSKGHKTGSFLGEVEKDWIAQKGTLPMAFDGLASTRFQAANAIIISKLSGKDQSKVLDFSDMLRRWKVKELLDRAKARSADEQVLRLSRHASTLDKLLGEDLISAQDQIAKLEAAAPSSYASQFLGHLSAILDNNKLSILSRLERVDVEKAARGQVDYILAHDAVMGDMKEALIAQVAKQGSAVENLAFYKVQLLTKVCDAYSKDPKSGLTNSQKEKINDLKAAIAPTSAEKTYSQKMVKFENVLKTSRHTFSQEGVFKRFLNVVVQILTLGTRSLAPSEGNKFLSEIFSSLNKAPINPPSAGPAASPS